MAGSDVAIGGRRAGMAVGVVVAFLTVAAPVVGPTLAGTPAVDAAFYGLVYAGALAFEWSFVRLLYRRDLVTRAVESGRAVVSTTAAGAMLVAQVAVPAYLWWEFGLVVPLAVLWVVTYLLAAVALVVGAESDVLEDYVVYGPTVLVAELLVGGVELVVRAGLAALG